VPGRADRSTDALPELDALWNFDDPAQTEVRFRDLLGGDEAAANPAFHAELLTQIARAEGLQMRFADAEGTMARAEGRITSDMPRARVRLLLERGRVRNSSGDPSGSVPFFEQALELARASGLDGLAVDAAHMLGIVEPGEPGLRWNELALAMAEQSADPTARRWRGSLYNNLGWTYHELGRPEDALRMFEAHLHVRMDEGDAVQARIAQWSIAKSFRFLGRVEDALALQAQLLDDMEGQPDGYVHEEIAECLLSLDRLEEARPHFAKAWELLHEDPWLRRDEPDRLSRLARLASEA
jgi:tetratricopeptide (TPR) repeat protein